MKKVLWSIVILALSINTFAVQVSDNDGSAFITKPEFEAIVGNFQSQIDNFYKTMDSKIDEAIVSYLEGVIVSHRYDKKLLISNYPEVKYFDNDRFDFYWVRPEWDCTIQGFQSDFSGHDVSIAGSIKSMTITSKWIPKDNGVNYGNKEITLLKNSNAGTNDPKYIWNGFYTNVKWAAISTSIEPYVPCDGAYPNIHGSVVDGPVLNISPGYYTSFNDVSNAYKFRRCIAWSHNNTIWPNGQIVGGGGYEMYGPMDCIHCGSNISNQITVAYDDDNRNCDENGNPLKLDNVYIIGYKNKSKHCNLFNDVRQIGYGKDSATGKVWTEKKQNFINNTTIDGETFIQYKWRTGDGNRHVDTYNGRWQKYRSSGSCKHSYSNIIFDKDNDYIPVLGGLGYIDSHNIRQEADNLKNEKSCGDKIVLKNMTLLAGFPVCIEKKDTKVIWKVVFKDKTKNYKVWLSYNPFDSNYSTYQGEPNDNLDLIEFNDESINQKYAIIKNGEGNLIWTMKKDSAVYLKWAICDGTGFVTDTKSGVLLLKDCNTYITEE